MPGKRKSQYQVMSSAGATALAEPPVLEAVTVQFSLLAPYAAKVSVAGTFNHWDVNANMMKKDKRGRWSATVSLSPGRYEYLFFADGQWVRDPKSEEAVPNSFGSLNSVVRAG